MRYLKLLSLLFFTLILSESIFAQSYMTEKGTAKFHSQVPLHSFTGSSDKLVGLINFDDHTIDFYIDLTTLDTGIGKRDRDMKETLETEKYPFAEFFGELISDFDPTSTEKQKVTVAGNFKMHGIEQEVQIDGSLQITNEGLSLYATWILKLEDYKIKPPQILFVKVDQEQEIEIEALLKPIQN